MSDNRPIGVFDSGLGGLTAVTHIIKVLPDERFIYFGDTARTPYGSKNVETIRKFSTQITDFLMEHNVKSIVIACNTVSATCINHLREKYSSIPILGIIEPTAKFIAETIDSNKLVGVIGTKATIESKQYEKLIHSFNNDIHIVSKACPLFVPMIEEGIKEKSLVMNIVQYYLDDFVNKNGITDLVLGCTHYPLLYETIKNLYKGLNIINPSQIIAEKVKQVLGSKGMLATNNNRKNHFYASDLSKGFLSMIDSIFPDKDRAVKFKSFDEVLEL